MMCPPTVLTFIQCSYDRIERICTSCRNDGFDHCEILDPLKDRSSRALSKSSVFNDIAETLNLAHQRVEWVKLSPSSGTLKDMIINSESAGQEDDAKEDEVNSFAD